MSILFSKEERKFSKNRIDDLYKYGQRIYGQSLIIIWRYTETDTMIPVQLLISVPKKKLKKAVNRNYTKRIIREVYRLNKSHLINLFQQPIEVIIKYNKTSLPEFNKLKTELLHLLNHDSFKNTETSKKDFN